MASNLMVLELNKHPHPSKNPFLLLSINSKLQQICFIKKHQKKYRGITLEPETNLVPRESNEIDDTADL